MTRLLLATTIWLSMLSAAVSAQDTWVTIRTGLDLLEGTFVDHGQTITFVLVRSDPKRNRLRVIDAYHELGKGSTFAAYSLREIKRKTGATIAVNAGSTASYSLPVPVGLLQIGGRIVSRANLRAEKGGVLCINRDHVSIVPVSATAAQSCVDAVQRGPYLSKESLSAVDAEQRYRRTLAGVDGDGRLLILVTRESTTLAGVASFLYTSKLNLNVQTALNLDGDRSSGLLVADGKSGIEIGSIDGLIASAIVIQAK